MTDDPPKEPKEPPKKNDPARSEGRRETVRRVKMELTWEGPFPPPATLRALDEAVPGAAKRVFDQFEAEGRHRRALEQRAQLMPFPDQIFARVAGLLFAAGCLWLISYAIAAGATWAAAVLSAAMVVGGINAIMSRRS